jgi:MFS transporter, PHS family, inorganic phosphate transporter
MRECFVSLQLPTVAHRDNFWNSYDIFAINIASVMLGYVYNGGKSSLSTNQDLGVKVATPIGTLVGQLLFGWLADIVGRKRMCAYLRIDLSVLIKLTFH